jgi:hypothetical protein
VALGLRLQRSHSKAAKRPACPKQARGTRSATRVEKLRSAYAPWIPRSPEHHSPSLSIVRVFAYGEGRTQAEVAGWPRPTSASSGQPRHGRRRSSFPAGGNSDFGWSKPSSPHQRSVGPSVQILPSAVRNRALGLARCDGKAELMLIIISRRTVARFAYIVCGWQTDFGREPPPKVGAGFDQGTQFSEQPNIPSAACWVAPRYPFRQPLMQARARSLQAPLV